MGVARFCSGRDTRMRKLFIICICNTVFDDVLLEFDHCSEMQRIQKVGEG